MCNLQGVSFYSLLQWRLSTTVSQPRLCSAWKLMCSAGPHQASLSLALFSPSPTLPWLPPPHTLLLHPFPPPWRNPARFTRRTTLTLGSPPSTLPIWELSDEPVRQCHTTGEEECSRLISSGGRLLAVGVQKHAIVPCYLLFREFVTNTYNVVLSKWHVKCW